MIQEDTLVEIYQGLPASPGIAIGPAWIYRPGRLSIQRRRIEDVDAESQRLEAAIQKALRQLEDLSKRALTSAGANEAAIFNAHKLFLEDVELLETLRRTIRDTRLNVEAAVEEGFEHYAKLLLALDKELFQARVHDVRDVKQRLLRILLGEDAAAAVLEGPAIVLAEDLTPSDTIQFHREHILGLGTVQGGPTSHTAILAQALGIPAVVGVPFPLDEDLSGSTVILDGNEGRLWIAPSPRILQEVRQRQTRWRTQQRRVRVRAHEPAVTTDGHRVKVVANIGNTEDAQQALDMGAEGIGLFRTEFLYLDRSSLPSQEEQVQAYRSVFEVMGNRPVVVRTLDIGGDKPAAYLAMTSESNPFLGWRAIRIVEQRPDVLQGQLRALLIAAGTTNTDLRIMVPLVSDLNEVLRARALLEETQAALLQEGVPLPTHMQFGMMVETPAAALLASHFARHVDFFSIGTNDLTQYTLAVDRTNERVAHLASPYHPAVLRLIAMTAEAAHENDRWVGLCGELAGDPLAVPLLLGLEVDEFSMAPAAIPRVKEAIRRWSLPQCRRLAHEALALPTAQAVQQHLQKARQSTT